MVVCCCLPVNLEIMDRMELKANQDVAFVPPPLQTQPEEAGKRLVRRSISALSV